MATVHLTFETCTVNNYDRGRGFYPRTLSGEQLSLKPGIQYPYTWVNVENEGDYGSGDGEVFCIYVDGQWHQAQSLDFNFN